jgi:hypothetical protein
MGDNSHYDHILFQEKLRAAEDAAVYTRFALLKPTLTMDGNQWCCLFGENLQSGVAGFGDTPHTAVVDWNSQWYKTIAAKGGTSPDGETGTYQREMVDAEVAIELERKVNELEIFLETESFRADGCQNGMDEARRENAGLRQLIEQMQEALRLALTEARSTHCENEIKAALEAAKGGQWKIS